jgi:hypothetical protein
MQDAAGNGAISSASAVAAASAVSRVGCRPSIAASAPGARTVVAATEPRARRTSVHGSSAPALHQASAITTLLIACARRVPILRKRTWRSGTSGMRMRRRSSSSRRAVAR